MTQSLFIDTDGSISGLVVDGGLRLDAVAPCSIDRITLIEWDESAQAWFIKDYPGGHKWTFYDFYTAGVTYYGTGDAVVMFDDYEEAVHAEVQRAEALLEAGKEVAHVPSL